MNPASRRIAGVVAGAALLISAPSALGQTLPAVNGYSAPAASIQTQVQSQTEPTTQTSTSSPSTQATSSAPANQLPFTGLDVGLAVLAGGVLLALGLGIRRVARPPAA